MTAIGRADERRSGPSDRVVLAAVSTMIIIGSVVAGLLTAQVAILAVAGAGALLLGTAIVLRPDVATIATLVILYSNAAVIAVLFHGLPLIIGAAVPLLLVVPLARDLVVLRLPVVAPPAFGWMVVLLAVYLLSTIFSTDPSVALDSVVVYAVEGVGLYFLLINVIRDVDMLRLATWALVAVGAVIGAMAVFQGLTDDYSNTFWGFAQVSDASIGTGQITLTGEISQPRLAGQVGETNRFAQVLLMLIPLSLYRAVAEPRRGLRIIAWLATTGMAVGVVLSFSRGAAVALVLLFIVLAILRIVRWPHLVAMVIGAVLIFTVFPHYLARVLSVGEVGALAAGNSGGNVENVILSRATEGLAAAIVMIEHPVLGVGPGLFPLYYQEYADRVGLRVLEGELREAHNLYLGLGAEVGMVGLAVFLLIAFMTLGMVMRARRLALPRRPDLERLVTPFGLALMTYYVTGIFLHLSFARYYWLMLAMATAAAIIVIREMATADRAEAEDRQDPYSQSA